MELSEAKRQKMERPNHEAGALPAIDLRGTEVLDRHCRATGHRLPTGFGVDAKHMKMLTKITSRPFQDRIALYKYNDAILLQGILLEYESWILDKTGWWNTPDGRQKQFYSELWKFFHEDYDLARAEVESIDSEIHREENSGGRLRTNYQSWLRVGALPSSKVKIGTIS